MDEQARFEMECRRVLEAIHPVVSGGSAEVSGSERDAVYRTKDGYILGEFTVSERRDKAEHDANKLVDLAAGLIQKHPDRSVTAFFITKKEPKPPQVDAVARIARKARVPIRVLSFDALRRQMFDSYDYLLKRADHHFGSARDPITGDTRRVDSYVAGSIDRRWSTEGSA